MESGDSPKAIAFRLTQLIVASLKSTTIELRTPEEILDVYQEALDIVIRQTAADPVACG
jgi:hypothetical protein